MTIDQIMRSVYNLYHKRYNMTQFYCAVTNVPKGKNTVSGSTIVRSYEVEEDLADGIFVWVTL